MTFSFVVPTFRRPDALRRTLAAVAAVDYPEEGWEVIVVDDGSGDETPRAVAEAMPTARFITQVNAGAATARNRGAEAARHEVLVFLDDDMIVAPDHLLRHEEAHQRFDPCMVNGHWEFEEALLSQLQRTPFGRFRLEVEEWVKAGLQKIDLGDGFVCPPLMTACNLSVRRASFLGLGGFDESFAAAGAEDQELSVRAREAGLRFVYAPQIRLAHNDGRIEFRQFCRRQREGARSAQVLATKHPAEFAGAALVTENGRVRRDDPRSVKVKKLAKRLASTGVGLAGVHAGIGLLERVSPEARLLRRAYWATTGLYIYRGILDQE